MEEAKAALNTARDVLGIVGETNIVPSSSIKGSNKEKAAEEMMKRVKEAIAKKGIKATKPNDERKGCSIYEHKRVDGSVYYVSCVVCYFPIL
jgi:hypothetical protein